MDEWKTRQIYNSALYIDNNEEIIVSAEKLDGLMKKTNKQIYTKKLKGHLYCPQCKKVLLAVGKIPGRNDYYLRTYPKQEHPPTCIKSINYVTRGGFDKFIEDENAVAFMNSRLNHIIDAVEGKSIDFKSVSLITAQNWKCTLQNELEDNPDEGKRVLQLPIKHLTSPMVDEYNKYIIYYGTVDLMFNKYLGGSCVNIFRRGCEQLFCLLTMSRSIADEIRKKFNLKMGMRYNNMLIAFIAKMNEEKTFGMSGKIIVKEYLVLREK